MDSLKDISSDQSLKVLIVCASWCGVCSNYKNMISSDLEPKPIWVDVDAFEAIADDLSVETFPTIVILNDSGVLFFGSIDAKQDSLHALITAVSKHLPIPEYSKLGELIREQLIK